MSKKHTCHKCEEKLVVTKDAYDVYYHCFNCFEHVSRKEFDEVCCLDPKLHFVKHKVSGGSFQLRKQCENCHRILGRSYPQKEHNMHEIVDSDVIAHQTFKEMRLDNWRAFVANNKRQICEELTEHIEFIDKKIAYMEYKQYLNSKKWKAKRKLVLKRDNYTCQSCLSAKARDVHHISYEHLRNEPLFELVSVCRTCHISITQMDRGREYEDIKVKLFTNSLS